MSNDQDGMDIFGDLHPYNNQFGVVDHIPAQGMSHEEILKQVQFMSEEEDKKWETGLVSGTMYHGGKEHYEFLNEVFSSFSYVNLLQRDMCPSGTKFEAEIVAMVAKMLHGDEETCGVVTSGGTESIYNSMFVYREWGRDQKASHSPKSSRPKPSTPRF
jgi:sphinganine-1-phosphate aldolase